MKARRNKRFAMEIPTGSLSDIMFFLLLFFLIISTLANPNVIKLSLPKASTSDQTNKSHITLAVTDDKRYFIDKTEVGIDQLESSLANVTSGTDDKTIILRIPYNLQVQDMVDVLQIGSKLGLNFVIATDKK
jgi:biopolymer transport protein ExbD